MESEVVACQRIIDATSPFDCFQLPRRTTDPGVIRSVYLKLAIKVHPDKNKCHLATQAFQVLSDSFEELHDAEKQSRLLKDPSSSKTPRKKKTKPRDVADLVSLNNRWYTRDWEEVEAEINRMTSEFKEHLARRQESRERQAERRAERRERKNKRIKRNLNYLYEKYGLDPDDSDDSDSQSNTTYDYLAYADNTPEKTETTPQNKAASGSRSESSGKPVCSLCQRMFVSEAMLHIHYEKSDLHKRNLEQAANPWHKFKKSFAEVKDPT